MVVILVFLWALIRFRDNLLPKLGIGKKHIFKTNYAILADCPRIRNTGFHLHSNRERHYAQS